ncbi:MAG: biopolymer transporter ExbD [Myxococcota bacterium]
MGASVGQSRGGRGKIVGINVTPMVDVVLVLLVIMMVSATYIVSQSMKVELPKTQSSDESAAVVASITREKDGRILFDQDLVDEAALVAHLKTFRAQNPDASLVVSADQSVPHGRVMHAIDLAKVEGITKFSISVERTE